MTSAYRTPEERDLTENEAYALARASTPFRLHRSPYEYGWGWVYSSNSEAYGPGPVSVTLRGEVISHGSLPMAFSDDAPPEERCRPARRRAWLDRLASLVARLTRGHHGPR